MKKADHDWANNPRWKGISRNYSVSDVRGLKGNVIIEHTLARRGAEKLWSLLQAEPYINALGALTGNQAMQQVKAGLKAVYLSGWQVAADANLAGQMYPDQSLYPANSVPHVVRRINQALQRADQIHHAEGDDSIDGFAPASTRRSPAASRTPPSRTWCGARPRSRTLRPPAPSRRRSTPSSPASCSPTTARRPSTGRRSSTRRRSRASSASWGRWATS